MEVCSTSFVCFMMWNSTWWKAEFVGFCCLKPVVHKPKGTVGWSWPSSWGVWANFECCVSKAQPTNPPHCVFKVWLGKGTKITRLSWGKDHDLGQCKNLTIGLLHHDTYLLLCRDLSGGFWKDRIDLILLIGPSNQKPVCQARGPEQTTLMLNLEDFL